MMRLLSVLTVVPLAFGLLACGGDLNDNTIDEAQLARFRAAIPSSDRLEASTPAGVGRAAGDAIFPNHAREGVQNINGAVTGLIQHMQALVTFPPSIYNSETNEYVWGPWDKDNGAGDGQVLAYIRENDAATDADFQYSYALVRLVNGDMATAQPVIWGGANPDPSNEDRGNGATLWDFEANRAFETANGFDHAAHGPRGRFVALYGHEDIAATQTKAGGEFYFNIAVFRDFIAEDAAADTPSSDLDYLFGHFIGTDGNAISFIDWQQTGDMCDAATSQVPAACFDSQTDTTDADEVAGLRMAFLNGGAGRAEVVVSGGDLSGDVTATECWSNQIESQYVTVAGPGLEITHGVAGDCGPIFLHSLDELEIPSLGDVPAKALADMSELAENGMPSDG